VHPKPPGWLTGGTGPNKLNAKTSMAVKEAKKSKSSGAVLRVL